MTAGGDITHRREETGFCTAYFFFYTHLYLLSLRLNIPRSVCWLRATNRLIIIIIIYIIINTCSSVAGQSRVLNLLRYRLSNVRSPIFRQISTFRVTTNAYGPREGGALGLFCPRPQTFDDRKIHCFFFFVNHGRVNWVSSNTLLLIFNKYLNELYKLVTNIIIFLIYVIAFAQKVFINYN
jgi:hypothetical protein